MLHDNRNIDLIERYFSGNLTSEEQKLFERWEKEEERFSQEVIYHKDFMESITYFGDQKLKAHFQHLEKNIVSNNNTDKPNK